MPTAILEKESRETLLQRLAEARAQTDKLFALVKPESLYDRPIPERHRIIFYRGHLEAFDWNLLQPRLGGVENFDPALDRLFAFGIDPVDGELPSDQPSDWPAIEQVEQYCETIRARLDAAFAKSGFSDWAGPDSRDGTPSVLLNVAVEHRLMHAETLAYMLHQLPFEAKVKQPQIAVEAAAPVEPAMVKVLGGCVTLGLDPEGDHFGWDNEYDAHVVYVPSFEIDRYKVTNGQYLEFVKAGGYSEPRFWNDEDWAWLKESNISHPAFWKPDGAGWRYRAMFDEVPLPLDWPVYVSQAEASAYARWAGKRLPTEDEWHLACYGTPDGGERSFPWCDEKLGGDESPDPTHGYFDFSRWDAWPVNAFPKAASAFGVEGMLANGWEWTSSVFEPFKGFHPFPFYEGYSANFFDGKHYVMKGGSTRTAASMLRRSFRNWFQPHYQYVYAGFRCASN